MSLIVALKHNGVVYMGSDLVSYKYGCKHYLTNPNNNRIFKVNGCDNMLMALDGKIVEQNIAKCAYLIPEAVAMKEDIDFEFLVTEFIPNLFELFDCRHILKKGDNEYSCDSDMVIAYKDKLFEVFSDGGVIESDDYVSVGIGDEEALGSLMTTTEVEDPKERILIALRAATNRKSRVSGPFMITDTKTCKFEIIEK